MQNMKGIGNIYEAINKTAFMRNFSLQSKMYHTFVAEIFDTFN